MGFHHAFCCTQLEKVVQGNVLLEVACEGNIMLEMMCAVQKTRGVRCSDRSKHFYLWTR